MGTYLIIIFDTLIIGIGYLYYRNYINKCIFYSDLLSFSQSLNNSVLILNTPLVVAIEEYDYKSKYTKQKLLELLDDKNKQNQNNNTLKDNNLFDIQTQLELIANSFGEETKGHIKNLENTVKQNLETAQKQKKEKGMLYFKLSIILALAITILMF